MAQDTLVRCVIEFQRILRRFHTQSVMVVLRVEARHVLWVEVEKHTDVLPLLVPKPPGTNRPDFVEFSYLENPI